MKKTLLLFLATLIIYSSAIHSAIHEFAWGACTLSFGSEYNFTRTKRDDGFFVTIKGTYSYKNSPIDTINTFECNDATSTKKKCVELANLINDIRYKNKKVTVGQLDDFLKN